MKRRIRPANGREPTNGPSRPMSVLFEQHTVKETVRLGRLERRATKPPGDSTGTGLVKTEVVRE